MPTTLLRSEFFDQADMLFALFDKDLNFIDVNEIFCKRLHLEKKDVIGKNIVEISPDNKTSGRYEIYKEVIRTGKTVILDDIKPHLSLGNFWVRVKAFKVGEGMATASSDITDLKEATQAFELFAYKSAHDMRAPVASLLGLINYAERNINSGEDPKKYLDMLKQQVKKLEDTITRQIDDTRRIQESNKKHNLINFRQIADDVFISLAFAQGYNDIRFEKEIADIENFYSDKSVIISLFQNIIDNAIKYRQEGNDSFLKITVADENDYIKIEFADNGIGIAEHVQKEVFDKFRRATNTAQGSGLGLYTIKHYIQKLGGEIKVVSKENEGTTFTVYMPRDKNSEQRADGDEQSPGTL